MNLSLIYGSESEKSVEIWREIFFGGSGGNRLRGWSRWVGDRMNRWTMWGLDFGAFLLELCNLVQPGRSKWVMGWSEINF